MTMLPSWVRYWGTQSLCYAAGIWCALWLQGALKPPIIWIQKPKPVAVRVAVKSSAPVNPAATQVTPPPPAPAPKPKVLPLHTESTPEKPKQKPKPPREAPPLVEPVTPVEAQPLPTLSQPPLTPPVALPMENLPPVLPPVPSGPIPPAPPDATMQTYPEEPGGSVLVLELTVNDEGRVVDSRILVPSSNALSDLTLALASRGQYWTNLEPPLAPGELRKLELRVPYADGKAEFNLP